MVVVTYLGAGVTRLRLMRSQIPNDYDKAKATC